MTDQQRVIQEYARRADEQTYQWLYSSRNPANLYMLQSRERVLMTILHRYNLPDSPALRILDVGCGNGGELLRWLSYGCLPANCAGIDLLPERIAQARLCLPAAVDVRQGDASQLSYPDASFDIVTQFTVFTSILDKKLRHAIASEMLRVLKPTGIIIWYDFWLNPTNPQTQGIRPAEIRELFPNCTYEFHRITLAPPITRKVAPVSWLLCYLLETIKLLNSHYLVALCKA